LFNGNNVTRERICKAFVSIVHRLMFKWAGEKGEPFSSILFAGEQQGLEKEMCASR
jgi:hypothetical protein